MYIPTVTYNICDVALFLHKPHFQGLQKAGIRRTDPRLSESMRKISQLKREGRTSTSHNGGLMLDKEHFRA